MQHDGDGDGGDDVEDEDYDEHALRIISNARSMVVHATIFIHSPRSVRSVGRFAPAREQALKARHEAAQLANYCTACSLALKRNYKLQRMTCLATSG